jgi:hypothetical protein
VGRVRDIYGTSMESVVSGQAFDPDTASAPATPAPQKQ